MYRFVSATHVLLNSSLDMSVYLINEYICMKDDLQLGKLKENSFPLIYQAASHPSYIYIFNTNKFYNFKN